MISGSNLSIFCYLGAFVSHTSSNYCGCLYESKWYNLSIEQQKYIILMIGNAERQLSFDGLKIIDLNLETLVKVNLR